MRARESASLTICLFNFTAMYLIARIDDVSGSVKHWFVGFTLRGDKVEVTTERGNARHFRRERDAESIRSRVMQIAVKDRWRVVKT